MPMADSGCEMLIRRRHVRETDLVPLGQHAFGIGCLNTFGDLLRCFAHHRKFASQLAFPAIVPATSALPVITAVLPISTASWPWPLPLVKTLVFCFGSR